MLVVVVIFLFLRNVSATIIPSLALPVSIVATFAVMYLLNYSLDNLSLMALTLCVGFVVDDAIVMLENIVRHMEMGKSPMQAAFDGSKEVAFTIVVDDAFRSSAVFIPVLFMGGIVGRLLHEFAVTIGVAILVSGFVSISLTPMLCSRFLKPPHEQKHGLLYNATERMFELWLRAYDWTLRLSLRFRAVTMAVSLALLVGTVYLFVHRPEGIPAERGPGPVPDHARRASRASSFDEMVRHQKEVADIVAKDPDIAASAATSARRRRWRRSSEPGACGIDLKPRSGAHALGRSDHREPPSEAGAGGRHSRLHGQPAADQPRRPAGRAQPLPVHAAGHRHRRALPSRRRCSRTKIRRDARASRTSAAICS